MKTPSPESRKRTPLLPIGVAVILAVGLAAVGGGLLVRFLIPRATTPPIMKPVTVEEQANRQRELPRDRTPAAATPKKTGTPPKREPPLFRGKMAHEWLMQLHKGGLEPAARREAVKALAEVIDETRKGRGVPEFAPMALHYLCRATNDPDDSVSKEALKGLALILQRPLT